MKDQFTDYKQSLALKELGFDEPCLARYWKGDFGMTSMDNQIESPAHACLAPLKSQVFKWFRDKKLSDGSINRHGEADGGYSYRWEIVHEYGVYEERHFKMGYKTYEEAEYACINELINIIKNK